VTSEDALLKQLQPYRILIPIRERKRFPAATLDRLPELELLAITGLNSGHVDVPAATRRGVLVVETGGSGVSAIEQPRRAEEPEEVVRRSLRSCRLRILTL